jgi:hypothetical protein
MLTFSLAGADAAVCLTRRAVTSDLIIVFLTAGEVEGFGMLTGAAGADAGFTRRGAALARFLPIVPSTYVVDWKYMALGMTFEQ